MARSIAHSPTRKETDKDLTTDMRAQEDAASMASYIADMASELSQLAVKAELEMVAYFLNLARVEAEIRSRELGGYVIERDK